MHNVRSLVVTLLIVAVIAFAVYAICAWIAHRPDIGRIGAAVIAVIGCGLALLDYTGN